MLNGERLVRELLAVDRLAARACTAYPPIPTIPTTIISISISISGRNALRTVPSREIAALDHEPAATRARASATGSSGPPARMDGHALFDHAVEPGALEPQRLPRRARTLLTRAQRACRTHARTHAHTPTRKNKQASAPTDRARKWETQKCPRTEVLRRLRHEVAVERKDDASERAVANRDVEVCDRAFLLLLLLLLRRGHRAI